MYGPLIVQEAKPPNVDADINITLYDWRLNETGALMGGFGNMHDFSSAGRLGNYAMILPSQDKVRLADRVRLRLINSATARVFPVRIEGLDAKVVALEGMPLSTPRDLSDLRLAPAQRADIIGDVSAQVNFLFVARDATYDMGSLTLEGENPEPAADTVHPLPKARISLPRATPDHKLTLRMVGGAMGGRHAGDDIWWFNGVSGMNAAPFATFTRNETAIIELVNDTSFPHGIHLHGHHFHEMKEDGALGDFRDTTLVPRGASRKIAAVFENPGKWLLHCHMLGHQASGMKTWIEVT